MKQTAKEMVKNKGKRPDESEFKNLCGIWSKKELWEFEKATKAFEKIDKEDWK
jgi:hypothetical protein